MFLKLALIRLILFSFYSKKFSFYFDLFPSQFLFAFHNVLDLSLINCFNENHLNFDFFHFSIHFFYLKFDNDCYRIYWKTFEIHDFNSHLEQSKYDCQNQAIINYLIMNFEQIISRNLSHPEGSQNYFYFQFLNSRFIPYLFQSNFPCLFFIFKFTISFYFKQMKLTKLFYFVH